MLTAMMKGEKLTKKAGQDFTVFTADQQLFRVIMDIIYGRIQNDWRRSYRVLVARIG